MSYWSHSNLHTKAQLERPNRLSQLDNQLVIKGETYRILFLRESSLWNDVYVRVKSLDYSLLETDWETTLLGRKVELEWRLKVFPSTSNILFLNFITPRYAILFSNSKNHIMHVINHEWNRFMFVASVMCFVWDTKPDLPSIGIRARFSSHACITCDRVLESKKIIFLVLWDSWICSDCSI